MFRYKRLIMSAFVVVLIAFTWLVAYLVSPSPWSNTLWYEMSGIWISELLLGVVAIGLCNNSSRALPFHAGNVLIAILHLLYSFVLLAVFSETAALLCVVGGLILALLMHTIFAFAQRDMKDSEAAEKVAFSLRNELLAALEMLEVTKKDMIGGDAALAKAFEKLKDDARFVSDAVPGCESADTEIRAGLSALGQCPDAESMTRAVTDLTARIGVRQNIVKRLR